VPPLQFSQDFDDLLAELNDAEVEFLIVGAHALAAHGHVRATGDLDVFIRPTPENAAKVMEALVRFGAPVAAHGVSADDFERPGMVYQLGLPPHRIDLLTELSGVDFSEAEQEAVRGALGSHQVRFIGARAQLKNKLACGRAKDLADAEVLEALLRQK
jgi:hypothetical protein